MNKNQLKMMLYAKTINQVMDTVESVQDDISPKFEVLRQALDDNKLASVTEADYQTTLDAFNAGTDKYKELLAKLQTAKAPARLVGNHKLLTGAFDDFVNGCVAMIDSMHDKPEALDQAAFDQSEADQDDAQERIMKHLQKISSLA